MAAGRNTGINIEVTFTHPETEESETTYVEVTDEMVLEALKNYAKNIALVDFNGTDNKLWNFLIDLGVNFDNLTELPGFEEDLQSLYKGSSAEDEDFEEWKDDYDFEHDLGDYADTNK